MQKKFLFQVIMSITFFLTFSQVLYSQSDYYDDYHYEEGEESKTNEQYQKEITLKETNTPSSDSNIRISVNDIPAVRVNYPSYFISLLFGYISLGSKTELNKLKYNDTSLSTFQVTGEDDKTFMYAELHYYFKPVLVNQYFPVFYHNYLSHPSYLYFRYQNDKTSSCYDHKRSAPDFLPILSIAKGRGVVTHWIVVVHSLLWITLEQ